MATDESNGVNKRTMAMPQIGVKVKIKPARVPKRGIVRPEGQRRIGPEVRKESR